MDFIKDKPYQLPAGTATDSAYVDMQVLRPYGAIEKRSIRFKARLDLGADVTCVPRECMQRLMPLQLVRPILLRAFDGKVSKRWVHRATVMIYGYPDDTHAIHYRLSRGVLLTDSDIGLVGVDILNYWNLTLDGRMRVFSVSVAQKRKEIAYGWAEASRAYGSASAAGATSFIRAATVEMVANKEASSV